MGLRKPPCLQICAIIAEVRKRQMVVMASSCKLANGSDGSYVQGTMATDSHGSQFTMAKGCHGSQFKMATGCHGSQLKVATGSYGKQ